MLDETSGSRSRATSTSFDRRGLVAALVALRTEVVFKSIAVGAIALIGTVVSVTSAPGIVGLTGAALALFMLTIAVIDRYFYAFERPQSGRVGARPLHAAAQEPEAMLSAVITAIGRAVSLALVFWAIRAGYARWRGRQGLGLGDVKLAAVAGAWLDWSMMAVAVEIATLTALVAYLLIRVVTGRPLRLDHRLPFGLFFAPAIWLTWWLGIMVAP